MASPAGRQAAPGDEKNRMTISFATAFVVSSFIGSPGSSVQAPSAATYRIAAVQVEGARRYAPGEVAKLSGLDIGKPVTILELAPAAEQLAATGLFKSLKYRYVTVGRQITVIFEIEEADWTVPVIFDNFVWFTDDDIVKSVRADVPSFDGTMPPSEATPDLVVRSLQKLLQSRQLPGQVHFTPQTDIRTKAMQYLFSVKDPSPKLCVLRVSGASALQERELLAAPGAEAGGDYSRFFLITMSNGTLLDMYHRRGHWRAAFSAPSVTLDQACGGLTAILNVSEGPSFAWDRAEWNGNAVAAAGDLDSLLGMKPGDVADASRIDAGLLRIRSAYRKQGYMLARASYTPRLDDPTRRAAFEIRVDEGPQFRMGSLEFAGIPAGDADNLRKKWQLKPGSVFDDSYPGKFQAAEVSPLRREGSTRALMETQIDTDQRVVNIRFVFK